VATSNYTPLQTEDGLKYLPPAQQAAFIGLLRAHRELTAALEGELTRRHSLSLSAYELLSRLAHAPEGHLRMSELAGQANLSLSRVSRLIDQLEGRGLVARTSCPGDSRVVHASLADPGRALIREAQETFLTIAEDRFLGRLSCAEVETLGTLFARLLEHAPDGATAC
jgi:DNA-binding MarR family transcriptional regulator